MSTPDWHDWKDSEADLADLARIIDDGYDDYQPFYDRHGKCISSDIAYAIQAAGFRRGAPADREQIADEIAAEREDTSDGFGFEAYINGLIRAEQIVREGR